MNNTNFAKRLLTYFNDRDKSELICKNKDIDSRLLVVISVNLLSWLKLEYKRTIWIAEGRRTNLKPLKLNMEYPWCQELIRLVQTEPGFKELFVVSGASLFFADHVDLSTRAELRKYAFEHYNPELHT